MLQDGDDAPDLTFRRATKDDLEHMLVVANLKSGAGKDITGDGGDYVREAWEGDWWTHDPRMHYEEFAFVGELAVGFARCDFNGHPDHIDSGWLEGLRVHPSWQGKKVMSRLQAHLMQSLPPTVREHTYMAVGSTNTQMLDICHGRRGSATEAAAPGRSTRYQYIGAWVMHTYGGAPRDDSLTKCTLSARVMRPDDMEAAWAFLAEHPLREEGRLLLPARFYAWRHLTRAALADKLAQQRVFAVGDQASGTVALFIQFDTDYTGWPLKTRCRFYLSYFGVGGLGDTLGPALHTFATSAPTADDASGEALSTIVVAGPHDNTAPGEAATCDVDPTMSAALNAAGFTRPRETHLRVYRVMPNSSSIP